MKTDRKYLALFISCLVLLIFSAQVKAGSLPDGFVYVKNVIPDIQIELRYYSEDNFIGERIDGYIQPECILTEQASLSLKKVQENLKEFGLGLKLYDAYRPQSAVDHFVRWAKDLKDIKMKTKYYPDVDKQNLFRDGYIAEKSSHSRGSTVDLTIIDMSTKKELDMGSGFDFFSPKSWPSDLTISQSQRAHRMLLQKLMENNGFKKYDQEWWHFTLISEPFPEKYFNFPIK